MNKRGQFLAAFILIGLAVVASFAFLYYLSYVQSGREFKPRVVSQISLTSETTAFKNYVQSCLEQTTREGLDYFGVRKSSEPLITEYIRTELPECIDFEAFEEFGMEIKTETAEPDVLITDKSVLVDLTYPITIEKQGTTAKMESFNYYMKRERSAQFTFDADDKTTEEKRIVTEDQDAELIIPAGTSIYDKDGHVLDEVTVKMLDRNFEGLDNGVVVGMVVYEGIPEGAWFVPPITIKVKYKDKDLAPGTNEETLTIAWFDSTAGIWKSLPSDVDTVNNIVTAQVSHFTVFSITFSCNEHDPVVKQTIPTGWLYIHPLTDPCTGWENAGGNPLYAKCEMMPNLQLRDYSIYRNRIIPNEPNPPLKDWDEDDQNAHDCNECHQDCVDMALSESCWPDGEISGDGILDGSCSCEEEEDLYGDTIIVGCEQATPATPKTYGYEQISDVGGKGEFMFTLDTKGNTCVANNYPITLRLECDDDCTATLNGNSISLVDDTFAGDFWREYKGNIDTPLESGINFLQVEVSNEYEACSWARGYIEVYGAGAFPDCFQGPGYASLIEANEPCYCGAINIPAGSGGGLYCCADRRIVEDPVECETAPCDEGKLLTRSDEGCSCGGQIFHYDRPLYCCSEGRYLHDVCVPNCGVEDNHCPERCSIFADADCCIQSGNYWLLTSLGFSSCYSTDYNLGCGPGQEASHIVDGCCPNWESPGTDADCCYQAGDWWLETPWGWDCYPEDINPVWCYPGQECSDIEDSCCPPWCAASQDIDC